MNGRIISLSLALVLSFAPVQANAIGSKQGEEERHSTRSLEKAAYYVAGGLVAIYGAYVFVKRRPPLGGLFLGAGLGGAFREPPHGPVHQRPDWNALGAGHDAGRGGCVQPEIITARRHSDPVTPRTLERIRLLLVEDEQVQRMIVERRLRNLGATVEVVADAGAALQAITERGDQFDVVLMDNNMPATQGGEVVLDAGLQTVRRIRTRSDPSEYRGPSIIMHSSSSIPPEVLADVGAVSEIVKGPSGSEVYAGTILSVVQQKKDK